MITRKFPFLPYIVFRIVGHSERLFMSYVGPTDVVISVWGSR